LGSNEYISEQRGCGGWREQGEPPGRRWLKMLIAENNEAASRQECWSERTGGSTDRMSDSLEKIDFLPTRASLLSRLNAADEDGSWREFFDLYWKLIYNAARKKGLSAPEAEDVVQETMITLMKELPGFKYDRAKGTFKGWLMTLTYRRISDLLRKRRDQASMSEVLEMAADSEFERAWSEEWRQNLIDTAVRRVRERTSPHSFQVYSLNILQKKGPRATARILNMSVAGVYMASFKVGNLIKSEIQKLKEKE
jgi:RNA polymerase sigma-70 factor (ECF subfamily)